MIICGLSNACASGCCLQCMSQKNKNAVWMVKLSLLSCGNAKGYGNKMQHLVLCFAIFDRNGQILFKTWNVIELGVKIIFMQTVWKRSSFTLRQKTRPKTEASAFWNLSTIKWLRRLLFLQSLASIQFCVDDNSALWFPIVLFTTGPALFKQS